MKMPSALLAPYETNQPVSRCRWIPSHQPIHWDVHDDVIKWKHFPRHWPFVREIHRSPVNSPHKVQWHEALILSLICAWTNAWVNNRDAGDLRRFRAHHDVTVVLLANIHPWLSYVTGQCSHFIHVVHPSYNTVFFKLPTVDTTHQWPLLLTWFNFYPSMYK